MLSIEPPISGASHPYGGVPAPPVPPPHDPLVPPQGLEIVNPQAAEKKVAEANQKYFSSMAEFLKVKSDRSAS